MRILKKILIVILVLVAVVLVAALFVSKDITIVKEVTINKPVGQVFNYVKYIKNQDNFSVWNQIDPAMKKTYSGTDGTVGFIYAWDSQNKDAGKGEQEIKTIEENKRVDVELRFKEPMEDTNRAAIITTAIDSIHTKVEWGFYGHMNYPMNIMSLFFRGMIGDDLQKNLNNLKAILEQ